MATKPKEPVTDVTVVAEKPAGTLAVPSANRFAALAAQAKEAAALERPNLSKISLKSGVITYGGHPVKDNRLPCIIMAASYKNALYKGRYDPNNIVNPNCFSLSEFDDDMVPDAVVTRPEAESCTGCPMREWGSDPGGGRGKACKETRRLIVLPASVLEDEDPIKAIKEGELAIIDIPVMSVKFYSQYINILSDSIGLPAWAVVTDVFTKPDPKSQFVVQFQGIKAAGGDDILDALEARRAQAAKISLIGYDATAEEGEEGAEPAGKGTPVKRKF